MDVCMSGGFHLDRRSTAGVQGCEKQEISDPWTRWPKFLLSLLVVCAEKGRLSRLSELVPTFRTQ